MYGFHSISFYIHTVNVYKQFFVFCLSGGLNHVQWHEGSTHINKTNVINKNHNIICSLHRYSTSLNVMFRR